MPDTYELEVDRNFFAFQTVVASLLDDHRDEFALLHDKRVVSIHSRLSDAIAEASSKFAVGHFSIQKVTDRPLDLGFFSHAYNPG